MATQQFWDSVTKKGFIYKKLISLSKLPVTILFEVLCFLVFFTLHRGLQAQEDFFASETHLVSVMRDSHSQWYTHMGPLSRIHLVLQFCDQIWKQEIQTLIDAGSIADADFPLVWNG